MAWRYGLSPFDSASMAAILHRTHCLICTQCPFLTTEFIAPGKPYCEDAFEQSPADVTKGAVGEREGEDTLIYEKCKIGSVRNTHAATPSTRCVCDLDSPRRLGRRHAWSAASLFFFEPSPAAAALTRTMLRRRRHTRRTGALRRRRNCWGRYENRCAANVHWHLGIFLSRNHISWRLQILSSPRFTG